MSTDKTSTDLSMDIPALCPNTPSIRRQIFSSKLHIISEDLNLHQRHCEKLKFRETSIVIVCKGFAYCSEPAGRGLDTDECPVLEQRVVSTMLQRKTGCHFVISYLYKMKVTSGSHKKYGLPCAGFHENHGQAINHFGHFLYRILSKSKQE